MRTKLTENILKHHDEHPGCFYYINCGVSYQYNIITTVLRLVDGHRRLTDYEFEYGGWDLYKDKPVHFKAICNKCNTILYKDTIVLEKFRTEHFDAIYDALEDIKAQHVLIREEHKKEKSNRQMSTIKKIMIGVIGPATVLFTICAALLWFGH